MFDKKTFINHVSNFTPNQKITKAGVNAPFSLGEQFSPHLRGRRPETSSTRAERDAERELTRDRRRIENELKRELKRERDETRAIKDSGASVSSSTKSSTSDPNVISVDYEQDYPNFVSTVLSPPNETQSTGAHLLAQREALRRGKDPNLLVSVVDSETGQATIQHQDDLDVAAARTDQARPLVGRPGRPTNEVGRPPRGTGDRQPMPAF